MIMKEFRYGEDRLTASIALDICRGKTRGIISDRKVIEIEKSARIVVIMISFFPTSSNLLTRTFPSLRREMGFRNSFL